MKQKLALILAPIFIPLLALQAQSNYDTPYVFTTFAGLASGVGSVDGTGGSARFNQPGGLAVDGSGNIYVTDTNNHTVRKITAAGLVTTFAGTAGSAGTTDGTGSGARFHSPDGATVDGAGNVYVADTINHTIRKITPGGVVTTLAGTAGSHGSTDSAGGAPLFYSPFAVATDGAGNVFVADTYNHTIRKVTAGGVVTTLAGSAGNLGSDDGTGSAARFYFPTGLTVDGAGNVYVADTYNSTIRKITAGGVVTTLAGSPGSVGSTNDTGSAARFNHPSSVVVDGAGNLFVTDTGNNTIRKVTAGGVVTTLAGSPGSVGSTDDTGSAARFSTPDGVAVDGAGNVYVSDAMNDTIRKITSGGAVTTLAGTAVYQSANGMGSVARFTFPFGVATDGSGNVYVADAGNNTIRKITPNSVVTTLAGTAGNVGSADGTGAAARFNSPTDVTVDGSGNVYVADAANQTVRKITGGGVVTTLAGLAGAAGMTDGTGSAARFNNPSGVAVDGSGNVYVADAGNDTIRKITPAGVVTTLAGTAGSVGSTDDTGSAARFNAPSSVAVDGSGNLFVTDTGNNTIRKITSDGVVTTLAGLAGATGSTDGTGNAARFNGPRGAAVDAAGNIYIADFNNFTVRKISPAGAVTTLGGTPGAMGTTDGIGSAARFDYPTGLAIDTMGRLYVADFYNNTIRKGVTPVALHDFNGDIKSDLIWTNTSTGDRAMWLMNGGTMASGALLGNVPTDWKISGTGDFNGDGKADVVLSNTVTGDRAMWLMDGPTIVSNIYLGNVPTAWTISAVGDFDGDGNADIFWSNTVTGDRAMWLMNGGTQTAGAYLGVVPLEWKVSGTGDFNGDGRSDLVWTNTSTGDRAMWMMNGGTLLSGAFLGTVPTDWKISGVGDFNGDGRADIVYSNTVTGDRAMWLMNGPTVDANIYLGNVPVAWTMTSVGDFDGDGKADIFWSNTATGDRAMWLMNGGTQTAGAYLGVVPVEWVNP